LRVLRQTLAGRLALGVSVGVAVNDLVYVPNATVGLNMIARSLSLELVVS